MILQSNGRITLGENIAENIVNVGGIKVTYNLSID